MPPVPSDAFHFRTPDVSYSRSQPVKFVVACVTPVTKRRPDAPNRRVGNDSGTSTAATGEHVRGTPEQPAFPAASNATSFVPKTSQTLPSATTGPAENPLPETDRHNGLHVAGFVPAHPPASYTSKIG